MTPQTPSPSFVAILFADFATRDESQVAVGTNLGLTGRALRAVESRCGGRDRVGAHGTGCAEGERSVIAVGSSNIGGVEDRSRWWRGHDV